MTVDGILSPADEIPAGEPANELSRLCDILIARSVIDQRSLARAQRVAAETGGRLDRVLTQFGLVSERGLAEAMAELLDAPLATAADFPETPLFCEQLRPKFLRKAQAVPIAANGNGAVVAMADPLVEFTRRAIEAAI